MHNGDVLILKGEEVNNLLASQELEIIRTVQEAYLAHRAGSSALPHSTFLRFPDSSSNRVIALPAYLGGGFEAAGVKWISSFPGNVALGMDRASAVLILNSTSTGRPRAILEASVISAKRTAASAALAARCLQQGKPTYSAGLIGCGLINFETARFLKTTFPKLKSLIIFDRSLAQAEEFKELCVETFADLEIEIAGSISGTLASSSLISIATTAIEPHINDLSACASDSTILHISLRDLAPELALDNDNIVDDIEHVCRGQTTLHLAEQLSGSREFIRCTLADILSGTAAARSAGKRLAIFSPFGLGVLDIAVGQLVCELALKECRGLVIDSFVPEHWLERNRRSAIHSL
jgi:2,3-diaminopropionate biosynthesis protein SbnB